jgi:ubiquinone biosynthesis protein COQ4
MHAASPAMSPPAVRPGTLQPRVAWQALKELLRDPDDTAKVFVILRALTGKSLLRGYNRFNATATGRTLLAERRSLIAVLSDRAALAALPADSLGRAYLKFVEREDLSADGLVEASVTAAPGFDNASIGYYADRLRDMHDLWHVTTGYGRDTLGELCLLGFTMAQNPSPGLALIIAGGAVKLVRLMGFGVLRALVSGYRNGRRARWLPAEDWEHLLTLPLETVRRRLGVRPPEVYDELLGARAEIATA